VKKFALFLSVACATQASATLPFTPESLKKNLSILESRTEANYSAITAVAADAKDTYKQLKEMGSDPKLAVNAPQVINGEVHQLELSKTQIRSLQENVSAVQADAMALLEQAEKLRSDRATRAEALLIQDQAEQLLSDAKRQETFIATHSESIEQWLSEARDIQSTLPAMPVVVAENPAEDVIEATSIVADGTQPDSLAPLKLETTVAADETTVDEENAPTLAAEEPTQTPPTVATEETQTPEPVTVADAEPAEPVTSKPANQNQKNLKAEVKTTRLPVATKEEAQKEDLIQLLSEEDLADLKREISDTELQAVASIEDETPEAVQPAFYYEPEPFVGEYGNHPKRKKTPKIIPVDPKYQQEDPKKTSTDEPHNLPSSLGTEAASVVSQRDEPEAAMEIIPSTQESDTIIPASETSPETTEATPSPETTTAAKTSVPEGTPLATIKFGPNAPTYKWYTVQAINRGLYQNPEAHFYITASEAGLENAEHVKTTLVNMGINPDQLHVTKGALEDGSTVHIYAR